MAFYRGMTTKLVTFRGHNGDTGEAYYAKPEGDGPFPAAILIHHMPGWDAWIMEATRKLAHNGIIGIAPNLYFRMPGASPDDQAAANRAEGGVSDDQMVGDMEGALAYLRAQKECNGRVGIMGFCSGGRHAFIAAGRIPALGAIVDCWGGSVIVDPKDLTPKRPVNPIDYAKDINCPILGIFGNEDKNPDPAQVDKTEAVLKALGKTYEFHRYDGAGHGFFAAERPAYRVEQATDGWKKTYAFFHKHLG